MTRERPLLMTPANGQQTHEGAKTQTRRIIKPPPGAYGLVDSADCPYGCVGDRLWIREAWRANELPGEEHGVFYKGADHPSVQKLVKYRPAIFMPRWACRTVVELTEIRVQRVQDLSETDALAEGCESDLRSETWWQGYRTDMRDRDGNLCHWQSPCRDTPPETMLEPKRMQCTFGNTAFQNYRTLWCQINGLESWTANPWVWALTFRKVEP